MTRDGERGSVLMMVAVLLTVLLAGAGVVLYTQVGSTRQSGLVRVSRSSLYCAEAGLQHTRATVVQQYTVDPTSWNRALDDDQNNNPSWYPVSSACPKGCIEGDAGDGGDADWRVTLVDNDDELPPLADAPTVDNDARIFIDSECIKYDEQPRKLRELIYYGDAAKCPYRYQPGQGCSNDQNQN